MSDAAANASGTPEVSATFCWFDYRDLDLDEAPCALPPIDGDWSGWDELVRENEQDMGVVTLRQGDDIVVEIEDSLTATITNLLIAVPDLVARRHVVISQFQVYGYIRMDHEASDELISGDHVPTVRIRRAGLIPALVELGERYLALLEANVGERDDFAEIIEDLRDDKLPAAREAVASWDGN